MRAKMFKAMSFGREGIKICGGVGGGSVVVVVVDMALGLAWELCARAVVETWELKWSIGS